MTRAKKLTTSLIAVALALVFLMTMLPSMMGSMNVEAKNADGRNRLGCWWWYWADATNATTRENYLTLLEETGVTEVYVEAYSVLWNTSNHAQLHTFIEAAQKHGMRTSVMIDDPALATSSSTSKNYIEKLYNGYTKYLQTYPDDWLYGIHFDVEAGDYTTSGLQKYCDNLVNNAKTYLINNGIYVEFDVNPAWSGASGVSYGGVTGFYNVLASVMANGKGTLSLMSYRTTGAKVMSRANEKQAVDSAKAYNCDYTYGIETDNVETGVDISGKTKAYLCEMLDYIFGEIDKANGTMNAGVAIHHARTYYQLSGSLPTTKVYSSGGTTASRASYSVKTTASTQQHTGSLKKTVIWEGDLSATVEITNYVGVLDNAEIDAAIRAELAKNGKIEDDEYYEIFTTGYVQGQSGYATAGFLTGDFEFWGDTKAAYCAAVGESSGLTCQKCIGTATDKKGMLLAPDMDADYTQLAYFSDADGYTDKVYITHLEINVYRYSDSGTTASQSQVTTQSTSQTSASSSQTSASSSQTSASSSETSASSSETSASSSETSATESTNATNPTASASVTVSTNSTASTKASRVIQIIYGDANDDCEVNMKDVLAIRKYLAGMEEHIDMKTADANGDGEVNMKDVLLVRKFVANIVGEDALGPQE